MISIKDLEDKLFEAVSKRIEPYGFKGNRGHSCFYRKITNGRLVCCLGFIRHRSDVDVTLNVAVRFDQLEDLINEDNEHISEALKKRTASLGVELGNLSEGRQKRWTVATTNDVEPVAVSIITDFVNIGLLYLDKYSNAGAALEALSGDDKEAWLHMPLHDLRAKRALGLAFLLGDRKRFSELAEAKIEFLESRNDPGLTSFVQFKEELENRLTHP